MTPTAAEPNRPLRWSDILLFPMRLILSILFVFLISALPFLYLIGYGLWTIYNDVRARIRNPKPADLALLASLLLSAAMWAIAVFHEPAALP